MGFDLHFRLREGVIDEDQFVEWFSDYPCFTFPKDDPSVASYFNPSTEVYFHFRWTAPCAEEPGGLLTFSINFLRPRAFALEAADHLLVLATTWDLAMEDPQGHIEDDFFDKQEFLRVWDDSNRMAYRSVLADPDHPRFRHAPRERIEQVWQWNYDKDGPLIGFATLGDEVVTVTKIDVDRATLLPRVDLVYVTRGEREGAFVPWRDAIAALGLGDAGSVDMPCVFREGLRPFLRGKLEASPVTSLDLQDVHATEDVA